VDKNAAIDKVAEMASKFVQEHYGENCKYQEDYRQEWSESVAAIWIVKGLKDGTLEDQQRFIDEINRAVGEILQAVQEAKDRADFDDDDD
jgi:hypothetical protein